MLSYGGVVGVRVALVDLQGQNLVCVDGKLEGVSFLNNFHYDKKNITVGRVYDIGKGKVIPWSTLKGYL